MLRNILFTIAVAVFAANAEMINLQGVVSNSSGDPIPDAKVSLVLRNMIDTTDINGKFSFVSTLAKAPPAITQPNNISLKNGVLQFTLNTQSPIKVELFDLKGNLLMKEVNRNAAAGTYRFDISTSFQSAKVLVVRAAIANTETSFRYMTFKGEYRAPAPLFGKKAISRNGRLKAMAEVTDTIKVTATGFFDKTVEITDLNNQRQNITLVSIPTPAKPWPTANPAAAGPFEVAADTNVGPLAGVVPDPIYKDKQQRFNVYRPKNLATSEYLHPILIWANGYGDNPQQHPPECVTNAGQNKWCGQYLPMMNHLASHGFVVVASLSSATGSGDPLPTIVGMDWIIKQNEDQSSIYYHRLDTSKIGQLGHSFGGMSTCKSAADPRYKALATICGTTALSGVHTPMMFFCGALDSTVLCSSVEGTFRTVKDQPAIYISELQANHGSWVYTGPGGVSLSSAAAWFRVHLMNDTANRKYFYGANCTFCKDSRVKVMQNSLMSE